MKKTTSKITLREQAIDLVLAYRKVLSTEEFVHAMSRATGLYSSLEGSETIASAVFESYADEYFKRLEVAEITRQVLMDQGVPKAIREFYVDHVLGTEGCLTWNEFVNELATN